MAVTSREIDGVDTDGNAIQARAKLAWPKQQPLDKQRIPRVYGLVAILIGGPLWALGAWYTASGWAWLLTYVLQKIGLPWVVPQPSGLVGVGMAGLLGFAYSRIEMGLPSPQKLGWALFMLVGIVWSVVMISDVGTTFAGTLQVPPNESLHLAIWLSANLIPAAIWSVILTFAPERIIVFGIDTLFGRR